MKVLSKLVNFLEVLFLICEMGFLILIFYRLLFGVSDIIGIEVYYLVVGFIIIIGCFENLEKRSFRERRKVSKRL